MRKLFSLLAMMVVTITAMAQTGTLQNANFSEGLVADASISSDGMKEVPSWRINSANGQYRAGAVVAYGSTSFVGNAAPAAGPEGSNGQGLAVLSAWTNTTQYVQDVTLAAGKYKMTVPVFNTAGTTNFAKNLIGVKYGETEKYATTLSYPVGAWTVEAVEFELTEETEVTVSLGYSGANVGNSPSQHLFIDCVKLEAPSAAPEVTVSPSFIYGVDEVALSAESAVSVEGADAIKVGFGEGADAVKYATYTISEYVVEDIMGVTTTQEVDIATGNLNINIMGYAQFDQTLLFKAGSKYNLKVKAWDSEDIFNPDFSIKDPVATFTCDFNGAYEEQEQSDLDFTNKVVKEVKACTSTIEEGKWYVWSNVRKDGGNYDVPTPFYDQGEGLTPKREPFGQTVRTVVAENAAVSDVAKYLVRFTKSGTGEAYHIQFATGNYLKSDLTTSATASEAGLFMVYAATNSKSAAAGQPYTSAGVGINITTDGTTYADRLDGNGAGQPLVTWSEGKITTADANNVWFMEEVEMGEATTETYTLHIMGAPAPTKVTYNGTQYGNNDTFEATGFSVSALTVPDHENYVKDVYVNGTDIYVSYTYAKKLANLNELSNERAYMLMCERGQLTTNEGQLDSTYDKSYTNSKSTFAFVKYEDNYYMWSTAENGFVFNDKTIATEGEFQTVGFTPQADGTFVLSLGGAEGYLNINSVGLAIDDWDTPDEGNKYSIYEVESFDATAALALLTPAPSEVKVTTNLDDVEIKSTADFEGIEITFEGATTVEVNPSFEDDGTSITIYNSEASVYDFLHVWNPIYNDLWNENCAYTVEGNKITITGFFNYWDYASVGTRKQAKRKAEQDPTKAQYIMYLDGFVIDGTPVGEFELFFNAGEESEKEPEPVDLDKVYVKSQAGEYFGIAGGQVAVVKEPFAWTFAERTGEGNENAYQLCDYDETYWINTGSNGYLSTAKISETNNIRNYYFYEATATETTVTGKLVEAPMKDKDYMIVVKNVNKSPNNGLYAIYCSLASGKTDRFDVVKISDDETVIPAEFTLTTESESSNGAIDFQKVVWNLLNEDTTGIATATTTATTDAIFSITGQRIMKLQKGINIVGGKKVIR